MECEISLVAHTALSEVFTPGFLRKLDRLHLAVSRSLSARPGNTPIPRRTQGGGIEIESHQPYGFGDDLRHVDWNAYGRLDELLIKRFRAEREAPLHVFVDLSASMDFPSSDDKPGFAAALAAGLAYVSLRNHDPVRIIGLTDAAPHSHLASPWFRHRQSLPLLREFLAAMRVHGNTALASGVVEALRQQRLTGVAVLISDFLAEPSSYERALGAQVARRLTVAAVRVLGPAERDPSSQFRTAQVVDAESGRERRITLSAANLAVYRHALDQHLSALRAYCERSGVMWVVADSSAGIDRCLFGDLPAAGLVH